MAVFGPGSWGKLWFGPEKISNAVSFYVFEIPKPWRKWMAFCSSRGPWSFLSWQHWASLPLFESCPHEVDFSHRSDRTRLSSFVDLSAPTSAMSRAGSRSSPPEVRKVSREAAGQNELYVGRGTADSFGSLKLARRGELLNCTQSGWSHRRTCCFSCRVSMENVCFAIAKVALRFTSILSSRSCEATDFTCLLLTSIDVASVH